MQLGLNMGPQHARVLGWAKSFTKNLGDATKVDRDRDAVGIISLAWAVMERIMPQEVIEVTNNHLEKLKLPELCTANISPGNLGKTQRL